MATELEMAVDVVDARLRAIEPGEQGIAYRRFFGLLLSGSDLDSREVTRFASAAACVALQAVDEGEHPPGAIAQSWARGLAVGLQLAQARAAAAAEAVPAGPDPQCGQVWEETARPRVPGMQHRRVKLTSVGFETGADYALGVVVRGEGAIRRHRVRLGVPALHAGWRLVTEAPSS